MKKIIPVIFFLCIIVIFSTPASAHKLISTDGSNNDINSALLIPDPVVSWAMYEELNKNALYYTFDAKKGDILFASIVIPKLDGLENFTPSLVFIAPSFSIDLITELKILDSSKSFPFPIPDGYDAVVFDYNGALPSKEFYEPFGQVTYWERQEVKTIIPEDGQYFILVLDEKNQSGKYSLAIGTIEDFSGSDFFTILPKAWFDTKIFVNGADISLFLSMVNSAFFNKPFIRNDLPIIE